MITYCCVHVRIADVTLHNSRLSMLSQLMVTHQILSNSPTHRHDALADKQPYPFLWVLPGGHQATSSTHVTSTSSPARPQHACCHAAHSHTPDVTCLRRYDVEGLLDAQKPGILSVSTTAKLLQRMVLHAMGHTCIFRSFSCAFRHCRPLAVSAIRNILFL